LLTGFTLFYFFKHISIFTSYTVVQKLPPPPSMPLF
jgi:hypothetical protein